jgi:hypothetical protein
VVSLRLQFDFSRKLSMVNAKRCSLIKNVDLVNIKLKVMQFEFCIKPIIVSELLIFHHISAAENI